MHRTYKLKIQPELFIQNLRNAGYNVVTDSVFACVYDGNYTTPDSEYLPFWIVKDLRVGKTEVHNTYLVIGNARHSFLYVAGVDVDTAITLNRRRFSRMLKKMLVNP